MKWPASRQLDEAFGPRFPNEFDFTLHFEHVILTIVPSLVLLLIALCYILRLYRTAPCAQAGVFSCVKLVCFLTSVSAYYTALSPLSANQT